MRIMTIGRGWLPALLCLLTLYSRAQNENTRAANWYTLQRLTMLANIDSSYLSAADKKTMYSLLADHSPTALCAKASSTPCIPIVNLPVTGLKLTGNRTSASTVKLDWETKAEYNSKGFVLERQSLTNPLQYDSVFYTDGQGTSYGTTKYSYTDLNSYTVTTYYRVREVDIDGNFTYSNIVAIDGAGARLSIKVAPNPASSSTAAFYIVGASSTPVGYVITNAAGRTIVRKENVPLSGNTLISLGSYHLATGFYFVTVFTEKDLISDKLIVY